MAEVDLSQQYREFADACGRDGATTYAAICRSVAGDPELLALTASAPAAQRRPNLLLAAVHFLLLGGAGGPLAGHYDTVRFFTGSTEAPGPDVGADFAAFCAAHRPVLTELIGRRNTQTNEVGRCTALLPALCSIAASSPPGQPLSLLDLGTSAGLNLLFDHYSYLYRQDPGGAERAIGDAASDVVLHCTVRSELEEFPARQAPDIAGRAGLDTAPIHPASEDGARWLLACLWPDHLSRFRRLVAALEVARTTATPPAIHTGDMIDDLAAVAATLPRSGPLVVWHSWVAAYLSTGRQAELVGTIRTLAADRPVHYLYAEAPMETPGLPTPPSPSSHPRAGLATALVHLDLIRRGDAVRLADMHPHGKWIRWWPTPADPTGHRAGPAPPPPAR